MLTLTQPNVPRMFTGVLLALGDAQEALDRHLLVNHSRFLCFQ